jgi:hypothetical protein
MIENFIVWALSVLVGAFIGSFLSGYLNQKGQNLATHEDINKLLDQVRAVTKTTKEIEAKISDEVWDRQKRWELKRDLLIDMVKKVTSLQEALLRLYGVGLTNEVSSDPENLQQKLEATYKSTARFNLALAEYNQGKLVVDLVCGIKVKGALLYYEKMATETGQAIMGGDLAAFARTSAELLIKERSIVNAVRDEIGSGPLVPALEPTTAGPTR